MKAKPLLNTFLNSISPGLRSATIRLVLIIALSPVPYALSQVPQGFNYQAIAWDATNKPIANTSIQARITIQSDSLGGTTYWIELFSSVTTNNFGLFTLTIGKGIKQTGSVAASFGDIDWRINPKFIKTEINYNGWKTMGSSRLMTVPYSMASGTLSGPVKKLTVNGTLTSPDSAIFEVKNNNGQTVFAVYNEGVRAYVDNGIVKGVTKGGFAIGGFGDVKTPSQQLMMISPDSARIYVDETRAKGATKGGFAIGGFNSVKGTTNKFMLLTPNNYFIGHYSGQMIDTSAKYNATMGYETAKYLTKGTNNIFVGYQSGLYTSTGSYNVFVGTQAGYGSGPGYFTGLYNIAIGRRAGYKLQDGYSNILIGDLAGRYDSTGYQNVIIGDYAGYNNSSGFQNIFLGAEAGWNNTVGNNNIFMGYDAGYNNTSGHDNVAIGNLAGENIIDGVYNVMIGTKSGNENISGDYNSFLGYQSGENTTGNWNTMLGYLAGNKNTTSGSQVLVGYQAGMYNTGGWNTMVGSLAGDSCVAGYENTYVGLASGQYCSGNRNVFLGRWAGRYEPQSNNYKLIIESNYNGSDYSNNALVYGDFSAKYLKVNGTFSTVTSTTIDDSPAVIGQHNVTPYYGYGVKGIGGYMGVRGEATISGTGSRYGIYGTASGGTTNYGVYGIASGGTAYAGYFNGNVYATGTITQLSDKNFKKNILPLSGSLDKVLNIQGVSFEWKTTEELTSLNLGKSDPGKESESNSVNLPAGIQIGVIAQDVEKIMPALVQTDGAGIKSVDYIKMVPLLIEAIKEQQKEIDELKALVNKLLQSQAK